MKQLPTAFAEQSRLLLGEAEYLKLQDALQQEPPVSIRVNTAKQSVLKPSVFDSFAKVPWCETGFYLKERLTFTFDPSFHSGIYYVQEASSMFVEQILRKYVTGPVVALDLCAAPGGKSTHMRSLLPEGSLLVANEIIRNRSLILAENIIKWGHPGVMVTNNDPSDFSRLEGFFDLVLTDLPCSGEGMFRKDVGAVEEWSLENVAICRQRQRRIITDIWSSLKPGGILIYSTCTYNVDEDEENVNWIMDQYGAEPLSADVVAAQWGITGNLADKSFPVYRFLPHRTKGEGFFLAALRKPVEDLFAPAVYLTPKMSRKQSKSQPFPRECKSWLRNSDDYFFEMKGSAIVSFPKELMEEYTLINQILKVIHAGVVIGELKGKDLIPHQSIAMSIDLNQDYFPKAEVTYIQSIAYLRKEAIVLDEEIPRGYVLLIYKGSPLGFVKNIGNRANNLYPQEWRIRSGYFPAQVRALL